MFIRAISLFVCFFCYCLSAFDADMIFHFSFDCDNVEELRSSVGDFVLKPREKPTLDFSTVEFVSGIHGKALHLKAGNILQYCLPKGVLTDLKPPFTIALWMKKTALEPTRGVFCATCCDIEEFGFEFSWFWRSIYFCWGAEKEQKIGTEHGSLLVNKWQHLAVTHDGETITLYIDAIPHNSKKVKDHPFIPVPENKKFANRFTIGQYPTGFTAYPHLGMMDDFVLFSRALNKEEIASLAADSL